jgi:hypothetical protein
MPEMGFQPVNPDGDPAPRPWSKVFLLHRTIIPETASERRIYWEINIFFSQFAH